MHAFLVFLAIWHLAQEAVAFVLTEIDPARPGEEKKKAALDYVQQQITYLVERGKINPDTASEIILGADGVIELVLALKKARAAVVKPAPQAAPKPAPFVL